MFSIFDTLLLPNGLALFIEVRISACFMDIQQRAIYLVGAVGDGFYPGTGLDASLISPVSFHVGLCFKFDGAYCHTCLGI